ncbi:MAG: HAD hydrolase family protein [Collinsella sp.]
MSRSWARALKGTALAWLCEPGRAPRHAWAFGDNINDIPMLQAVATARHDQRRARGPRA